MKEKYFFSKENEYMGLFEKGKVDEALKLIEKIWGEFKEPKVEQDLFYLLIEDLIKICIKSKRYDLGNKYISLLFVSGLKRVDDGDREFLAGALSYEQGNLEIAKELFYIADYKSSGRIFREKEYKKYRKFLNESNNVNDDTILEEPVELTNESHKRIMDICKKGDESVNSGKCARAIRYYLEALELVPEPKNNWSAATWIYTALGDTYFLLSEYSAAKDYLFDALNCPEGMDNPFINLRLGQSFYKLGNVKEAREYLIKAYMVEGTNIFKDEDDEYFKAIEDLV